MITLKRIVEIKEFLAKKRAEKHSIGFVPTMGALHAGHIALIERCRAENGLVVASIFVNPTQFNNKEDLAKYPRTLEVDSLMLEKAGCDVLFAPEVEEIYPEKSGSGSGSQKWESVDLGNLDKVMEGAQRPGHFKGVIQVVSKLFDIVEPDRAYFGQKDFQQLAVIRELVRQLNYRVEIIPCPTIRESDGLAMSSRNVRLTADERRVAPKISQILFQVKELSKTKTADELKIFAEAEFKKEKLFTLEYVELADAKTLMPVKNLYEHLDVVVCVALKLGNVRLIDNILL